MHFDARENTYRIKPTVYGKSKCIKIDKRENSPEEIEKERIRKSIETELEKVHTRNVPSLKCLYKFFRCTYFLYGIK